MPDIKLPKLVTVTVHKSGTHLIHNLVDAVGYIIRDYKGEDIIPKSATTGGNTRGNLENNTAYFVHAWRWERLPGEAFSYWRSNNEPRFIYLYRDPRAVLLSQVNYLRCQNVGQGFTYGLQQQLFSDILCAQLSETGALDIAIKCMHEYMASNFTFSTWMLHHPKVLCVSYEKLVGPRGGGTLTEQVEEVARVLRFVGSCAHAEDIAPKLYDPTQRTFHKGHADRWREVYTFEQLQAFERRYGDLVDMYGYRRVT